jgi:hypothetical protein
MFYVLRVNVYCHRVPTQLQLTKYQIKYQILIFGLTLFDLFINVCLRLFCYGNIIFDLHFLFVYTFHERS